MGAIGTLNAQHLQFDIVTGISIGSLVGAVYTQQKMNDLDSWINSFTSGSVAQNLFSFPDNNAVLKQQPKSFDEFIQIYQKNGPSVDPLRKTFSQIFDFEAFSKSPIDYACLAANLSQNKEQVFYKKDMTAQSAEDCFLASSAYFPAFSFVEIDKDYYADGGYLDTELGKVAMSMGAQDLSVIALVDPYEKVNYDSVHTSLLIRPILKLQYFLNFDPAIMKQQIMQGQLEALKYMNLAPGFIYTFYHEDRFLLDMLAKAAQSVLRHTKETLSNEQLIDGISILLGYRPYNPQNEYMNGFQPGLIMECLALIAGISPYQQYHIMPFVKEILGKLQNFQVNANNIPAELMTTEMDEIGARDMLNFFHNAMQVFDGKLPDEFDFIIKKFKPLYYLALAWHILDKFSLVIDLF